RRMQSYPLHLAPSWAVPGEQNGAEGWSEETCDANPSHGALILRRSAPVAEQFARRRASALTFFKNWLTVDHDPAVPFATPDPTPFVGRNIVEDVPRQSF